MTEDDLREAPIYLQWQGIDVDSPVVGLHTGASWPAKVWLSDRFAYLADRIVAKLGAQVLITQGPKDREIATEVSRRCIGNVKISDILLLRQLAAILSHIDVFVTNN